MKCWLITASSPFYGTEEYYGAYAEENPEEELIDSGIYADLIEDLWNTWSHLLCIEDDEDEELARENWDGDCSIDIEEIEESKLSDYFPEEPNIIYDERINISTGD